MRGEVRAISLPLSDGRVYCSPHPVYFPTLRRKIQWVSLCGNQYSCIRSSQTPHMIEADVLIE
jgi:hypothetical protein